MRGGCGEGLEFGQGSGDSVLRGQPLFSALTLDNFLSELFVYRCQLSVRSATRCSSSSAACLCSVKRRASCSRSPPGLLPLAGGAFRSQLENRPAENQRPRPQLHPEAPAARARSILPLLPADSAPLKARRVDRLQPGVERSANLLWLSRRIPALSQPDHLDWRAVNRRSAAHRQSPAAAYQQHVEQRTQNLG